MMRIEGLRSEDKTDKRSTRFLGTRSGGQTRRNGNTGCTQHCCHCLWRHSQRDTALEKITSADFSILNIIQECAQGILLWHDHTPQS